jgi:two-component system response regulator YesN
MWKMLIVEDEVRVRTSLKRIIDWNESGFEVIGEAGNGARALEFMEREVPDLVLCDILMPVMDGIELLKKAREAGYSSLFVMLTCMNEFEYARMALQYGAFDYILKLSMDVDTLRDVLAKADATLRQQARLASRQSYYEYRRVYEAMWEAMLLGKPDVGIQLPPEPARERSRCVAVCAVHHGAAAFTADDFAALELVAPDNRAVVHEFTAYGVTTFFYWSRTPVRLRGGARRRPAFPVAVCFGGESRTLYETWAGALSLLDRCWYGQGPDVFVCGSAARREIRDAYLSWNKERRLIRCVEQGRLSELEALLAELWQEMERRAYPMVLVKQTALQLDRLAGRIAHWPPGEPEALTQSVTHHQLLQQLGARLRNGMERLHGSIPVTDHDEINKILEYVHRHFDEAVSLKAMARYVAMEEHYLSSLFKKKTGRNFIDYLHDVRIEQAKQCLDRTDMTVNEIGRRVGFFNDNYFIKIFKRRTGMTPSQYRRRKLHQNA